MIALHRVARLLGLVPPRHCAGSYTGWSGLARIRELVVDDFSRPRTAPLAVFPMASTDYLRPYPSKDAA